MRADHLRPLVRLLHRSDREEAAQPFPARHAGAVVRHRRLQSDLQVLPELGHLQGARARPAAGRGLARGDRRAPRRSGCRSVAYTYNDPGRSSSSTRSTWREACRARGLQNVAVTAGYIAPAAARGALRRTWTPPMSTSRRSPRTSTSKLCTGALQPVLETLEYLQHETERLARDHDAADPRPERRRRGDRGAVSAWVMDAARPRRAAALHRLPPGLQDARRAAHAARDADPRARASPWAAGCATSTPATCTTRRARAPTAMPAARC